MPAPMLWSPTVLQQITARVLYLCALQRSCDIQLAWWVACNEAAPPTNIIVPRPSETRPWTAARKWTTAVSVTAVLGGLTTVGVLIYRGDICIPSFILNIGITGMMIALWTMLSSSALYCIFRRPLEATKVRSGSGINAKWIPSFAPTGSTTGLLNWSNPRVNLTAGLACAISLIYALYAGYTDVLPVALASGVLSYNIRTNPPLETMRLRRPLYMIGAIAAIFGVLTIFDALSSPQKKESTPVDGSTTFSPPAWLNSTLGLWISVILASMPGPFLMINMRYEHSRVASPDVAHASTTSALVKIRPTAHTLPLHLACLGTAAVFFAALDIAHWRGLIDVDTALFGSFVLLTPLVAAVSAAYTWRRGDLKAWWQYKEVWHTPVDWSVTTEVDEDSQLLLGVDVKEELKA